MNRTKLSLALGAAALAIAPAAADAQKPPKPPKTPKGGKLTLAATPNPVTYGSAVRVSGKLNGSANGGQPVSVQSDLYPFAAFKTVATATTTATGDYAVAQKPLVNTRYRAMKGAELSGVVEVQVRPRVTLRLSDYTPEAGPERALQRARVPAARRHDAADPAPHRHRVPHGAQDDAARHRRLHVLELHPRVPGLQRRALPRRDRQARRPHDGPQRLAPGQRPPLERERLLPAGVSPRRAVR